MLGMLFGPLVMGFSSRVWASWSNGWCMCIAQSRGGPTGGAGELSRKDSGEGEAAKSNTIGRLLRSLTGRPPELTTDFSSLEKLEQKQQAADDEAAADAMSPSRRRQSYFRVRMDAEAG